jgi:hypothetical protein
MTNSKYVSIDKFQPPDLKPLLDCVCGTMTYMDIKTLLTFRSAKEKFITFLTI